ncbi:hypothetical protein ACMAZF_01320 [Psychrobium sp. nBUS_13]|uniref:hypothetical protein n=1 Tax=Psychrobium sp. nBUS_13 TaxID=3395319 RepID=UPI003EBB2641
MGGKSRSKQETTNTSSNTNIVNDGEFAGAGNVTIDESDHRVTDSNNTDNSIELEDSFNTDNSIDNGGDYAGNNGTITMTDSGSIKEAFSFGRSALSANENALESAFDFGSDALDEVQTLAVSAFENSTKQADNFSDNVQSMLENGQRSQENILKNAAKSNSDDRALIADLARSTSLAGQDIVAKSSQKMTLYMAIALGLGFIAIVVMRSND